MRMVLIGIFLFLFAIISLPLYLVAWLLGKKDEKLQIAFSQKLVRGAFRIILFIAGARIKCEGLENVPKDEAFMYIANHKSYCDILAGYVTVPTLTGFVSKDTLKKAPCISRWMKFLKCLFLNREDPKEGLKVILTGIEQMKRGLSIFIMPEGTRSRSESLLPLLPFHEGSFKLATKTGCGIVPVAMSNTHKVFSNHFGWFHPVTIHVVYGKPVYPKDLAPEEKKHVGAYMQERITKMLENM